jgi:hypothetical protein
MSLNFANTTDYVNCASAAGIDNIEPFTFWAWIYLNSLNTDAQLFGKRSGGAGKNLYLSDALGNLGLYVGRGTGEDEYITNDTPLSATTWQFVSCTHNSGASAGQRIHIYTGTLSALATERTYGTATDGSSTTPPEAAGNFVLGNESVGASLSLRGRIAVAGYVSGVLTLAQIQSLQFMPRRIVNTIGFWQLGFNGTGTQADLSGNGHNGTVSGAVVADHVPLAPPFAFDMGWMGNYTAVAGGGVISHIMLGKRSLGNGVLGGRVLTR